jgi:protein arginine kinase
MKQPLTLDQLLNQTGEWLRSTGPHHQIVLSSRIRLARNLAGQPFPHWATPAQRAKIVRQVVAAVGKSRFLKGSLILPMKKMSELDRQFLVERHLISRDFAQAPDEKTVVVSDREVVSIMINEEDHLRLQVMQSGLQLTEAWAILQRIDQELEKELSYAFRDDWGYLTACPTNVGTGMRASCMLHLPCLVMTRQMERVLNAISKLGMTARGFYGEGTEAAGNFYQLSNQVTLGISEADTIDHLDRIIQKIVEQEEAARKALLRNHREILEDKIWRAYGALRSAAQISSGEAAKLLSLVRLGIDIGRIPVKDPALMNRLFVQIQPAYLQKLEGKPLSVDERDKRRAQLLRETFSS